MIMAKKCILCDEKIYEEYNKLQGSIINVRDEKGEKMKIFVCSDCQKKDSWVDNAKIKSV